jgi:hypothetical protein
MFFRINDLASQVVEVVDSRRLHHTNCSSFELAFASNDVKGGNGRNLELQPLDIGPQLVGLGVFL